MDGAGAPAGLRGPRHPALDREVDLEGGRPVLVAAVGAGDPAGQPVADDLGDGAVGARSKATTSGQPSSASERTRTPVSIRPAVLAQHRRPARRRSTASRRPATGQPTLWPAEISAIADRGADRPRQRAEGVGGDAAEQRSRRRRLPAAGEERRRRRRRDPEAGQPQRVLRQVQDRPQHVLVDRVEVRGGRREQPPPGAPVLTQPRRRLAPASGPSSRRCRRRAGGRGRPRASATRARASPAPASGRRARPPPSGARPSRRRG